MEETPMDIVGKEDPLEEKKGRMDKDFSDEVAQQLPLLQSAAKADLAAGTEQLLALEKRCRKGGDALSASKVAQAIVGASWDARNFGALNDALVLLAKRRGQFKLVTSSVVNQCIQYLSDINDEPTKLHLIDTLRQITEGKIFVENERARLTRQLAVMAEEKGDVERASKLMQEIQIETYNSMENLEKTDFILEQMRLTLATHDYVRTQIISRKISSKVLNRKPFEQLKVRYQRLMIQFFAHSCDYLAISRAYLSIYNTPHIQSDPKERNDALSMTVLYLILSPFDNTHSDLCHNVFAYKHLDDLPRYRSLLKFFLTNELMDWPQVEAQYAPLLNTLSIFSDDDSTLWSVFKKRVVEHNVRVIAMYYMRCSLKRMANLLHLSPDDAEDVVCDLVVKQMIHARIDRSSGVISFRKRKQPNELMDDWAHNIGELLGKLEKASHLIHREHMIHKMSSSK